MDQSLRDFISSTVNSRTKLELLAYLSQNPYTVEALEGMAARLHRQQAEVETALAALVSAGVVGLRETSDERRGNVYSYAPSGPLAALVEELVAAYHGPERAAILEAVNDSDAELRRKWLAETKQLDDLKTRFVSMVSHELRTPVTIIKGILTALLTQPDLPVERQRELMRVANRRCGDLIVLIENLLTMSGIHGGEPLRLELERVSLQALAEQIVTQFEGESEDHEFNVTAEESVPLVLADEQRVRQVLLDLLDNAVKFSPRGGRVRLTIEQVETDVVVAVDDEGVGLSPGEIGKVFDRFYQVEPYSTRRAGGCGIGLFLARRVVVEHGGRIWIESKPERGLRVSFSLPIGGPPAPETEATDL